MTYIARAPIVTVIEPYQAPLQTHKGHGTLICAYLDKEEPEEPSLIKMVILKRVEGRTISWSSSRKPLATSLFGAVVASVHAPLAYDWLEPAQTIHSSDIL